MPDFAHRRARFAHLESRFRTTTSDSGAIWAFLRMASFLHVPICAGCQRAEIETNRSSSVSLMSSAQRTKNRWNRYASACQISRDRHADIDRSNFRKAFPRHLRRLRIGHRPQPDACASRRRAGVGAGLGAGLGEDASGRLWPRFERPDRWARFMEPRPPRGCKLPEVDQRDVASGNCRRANSGRGWTLLEFPTLEARALPHLRRT